MLSTDVVTQVIVLAGVLAAIALAVVKWRYWRDIDGAPLPMTRGDAVGLPGRTVSASPTTRT